MAVVAQGVLALVPATAKRTARENSTSLSIDIISREKARAISLEKGKLVSCC